MIGWSGDAVQLQADNPNIEWRMPTEGCMLWSDNMVIPVGAPNPTAAEAFMNYVYDPKNQAQIADIRQLRDAGRRGRRRSSQSSDPELAEQPADLPERVVHQEVLDRRRRSNGEEEQNVIRAFEAVAERLSAMSGATRAMHRCRRYFLLGPGTLWLVLFFVVPLYFMGKLSLESGLVGELRLQLELVELHATRSRHYDTQFVRSLRLRGHGDAALRC